MRPTPASGGNGIYVRPDSPLAAVSGQCEGYPNLLGNAELLRGKTIIGNLGTSSQPQTILYLEHFGLTQDDINLVNMGYRRRSSGLQERRGRCRVPDDPLHLQRRG